MLKLHKTNKIYEMNKLDELFDELSPSELLFRLRDGFNIDHNYFIVNMIGSIKSFRNFNEAVEFINTHTNIYNNIIETLKGFDEPGIIINWKNSQILEAGDRHALVYRLEKHRGNYPVIVNLPNNTNFIIHLLASQESIRDFHLLTNHIFD